MPRKSFLLFSCMSLAISSAMPVMAPLLAQAQDSPGFTATQVSMSIGSGTEVFQNIAKEKWERTTSAGQVTGRYKEAGRDEWSIYLSDEANPQMFVQIDLFTKKVVQQPRGGAIVEIGRVTASSSATLATTRAVQPPVQTALPKQQATTPSAAEDEDFNPFAGPDAKQVTNTQSPAQQPRDNKAIITSAANNRPPFTQREPSFARTLSFDGPWVEDGVQPKRNGDGVTNAITWTVAETIYISSPDDDTLTIFFDKRPADSISLRKTAENQFAGGGYTARFFGLDKSMRLNLDSAGARREFAIAKVPSGAKLSRARTRPEDDNEIDTFTSGALIGGYNEMLSSYRSEKMDLFNPSRAKAAKIFKSPESTEFSVDPNLRSAVVPLGINGTWFPQTEATQLESVITNMASFEKSMSLNFGLSGSFRGATGGAEATREESKGAERTDGTTKAYGLARAEVYTLFLDKPNMLLDPGFKLDILQLADGTYTADQFRKKYGTHYAASIQFGGIGKNQRTVTTEEFKKWSKESTSYKQEGGFDAGPAGSIKSKGGLTMASGDAKGGTSMFSSESWKSVGGTGSVTSMGWTVDLSNAVPVRYDLRPLSELISPIFLPEEWATSKRGALLNARAALDNEITRYLQSQPKPDDRLLGPIIYRLKFHSLVCVNNGDDGKADAELYGNITAKVHGLEGFQDVVLLDASEDNMASFSCSGGKEYPINREVLVAGNRNPNGAGQGSFQITATGVYENDPTALVIDDPITVWPLSPAFDAYVYLKDWTAKQPRTDLVGTAITNLPGMTNGPDIRVKVSFEAIQ